MKKVLVLVAAMMAVVMSAKAEVKFGYEAGAEIVSSYVWRGLYNGGLSFQPTASIGFDAADENIQFRIGAWGNIGASDWKFTRNQPNPDALGMNPNTYLIPEVDLTASFKIYGITLGATHYYYFGGTPFFSDLEEEGGSQTEVMAGFNLGDVSKVGLYFNWYTMIAGNDCYYDDANVAHRAWSSYIEVGYDLELPMDFTLGVQVGMTPWKSLYTGYDGAFAVNNVQLRLGKTWEIGEVCELELYALGSVNTYGINKSNLFINESGDYKFDEQQKLNGCLGLGIWF